MKEMFKGVFKEGKRLYTINAVPGKRVYGERLVKEGKTELRDWDPSRSKLGAAIMNGLKELPIKKGAKVLYLGASTGTTPSHVSDILGPSGIMYGIEFAERVFRSLTDLCKDRKNIAPILADARKTEKFYWVEECDVVFVDISQPDEVDIAIRDADEFMSNSGTLMISVKSQSIDVTKKPEDVYKREAEKIEKAGYKVVQMINLEPFEHDHAMIIAKK